QGRQQDAGSLSRVAAMEIERRVVEAVRGAAPSDHLERSIGRQSIQRVSRHPGTDVAAIGIDATVSASSSCAFDVDPRATVGRVTIRRTTLEIQFAEGMTGDAPDRVLVIPWTPPSPYRRREIIQGEGEQPAAVRPMRTKARAVLIDALRDAHRWLDELTTDSSHTIESIAAREKKTERSIRLTMSLAFLSPTLVKAAIDGRLPRGFGVKRLMDLPIAWSDQWSALGLKAPAQTLSKTDQLNPSPAARESQCEIRAAFRISDARCLARPNQRAFGKRNFAARDSERHSAAKAGQPRQI